jgi:hypothetical protein
MVQGRISGNSEKKQRASVHGAGYRADSVASHTLDHPARSKLYNLLVGNPVTYFKVQTNITRVLSAFCDIDASLISGYWHTETMVVIGGEKYL